MRVCVVVLDHVCKHTFVPFAFCTVALWREPKYVCFARLYLCRMVSMILTRLRVAERRALEEGRRAATMERTSGEREEIMNSMREALSKASNGNDTLVAQLASLQVCLTHIYV